MRVLVTGGSGLVGRFIVNRLVAGGHQVTLAGRTEHDPRLFSKPVDFRLFNLNPRENFAREAREH